MAFAREIIRFTPFFDHSYIYRMAPIGEHYRNYSQRTKLGTFRIELVILRGSWLIILWFTDTRLGTYNLPSTAAKSISDGKHDQILGFEAATLGVPRSPEDWNGLR
jgi:hypothetical protein